MKQLLFILISTILMVGCQQDEEAVILQETGIVINYSGTDYCNFVIELENGQKIQPHYYPEGFEFVQGQRLLVDYIKLPNIVSTCGKGTVCELINVEVLDCGFPVIELGDEDLDTFANDPLIIHDISLQGDCLNLMVSYSGGCQHHEFQLFFTGEDSTEADTAILELRHDANNDMCEAALSKELQFNLNSLKEKGYTKFQVNAFLENGETYSEIFESAP